MSCCRNASCEWKKRYGISAGRQNTLLMYLFLCCQECQSYPAFPEELARTLYEIPPAPRCSTHFRCIVCETACSPQPRSAFSKAEKVEPRLDLEQVSLMRCCAIVVPVSSDPRKQGQSKGQEPFCRLPPTHVCPLGSQLHWQRSGRRTHS